MGKLKAIHIICKRDTEIAKVAPESVLNNRRGEFLRYALDQVFAREGVYLR